MQSLTTKQLDVPGILRADSKDVSELARDTKIWQIISDSIENVSITTIPDDEEFEPNLTWPGAQDATGGNEFSKENDAPDLTHLLSMIADSGQTNQAALQESEQVQALIREQIATEEGMNQQEGGDSDVGSQLADLAQSSLQSFGTEMAGEMFGTLFGHGSLEEDLGSAIKYFNDPDQKAGMLDAINFEAITGAAAGALLNMATKKMFSSVWSLDKDSSAGEVAAYGVASKYLQAELASQVLGSVGLTKKGTGPLSKLLCPSGPSLSWPALSVGHMDESSNPVLSGMPTVLVEGRPMSRMGDQVDKAGQKIFLGSGTVSAGGMNAALAHGVTPGSMSAPGDFFPQGAGTVFIGGPVVGSIPAAGAGSGAAAAGGAVSAATSTAAGAMDSTSSESNAGDECSQLVGLKEVSPHSITNDTGGESQFDVGVLSASDTGASMRNGESPNGTSQSHNILNYIGDFIGKLWNIPNTTFGLVYGGIGHVVGEIGNTFGFWDAEPLIRRGNNAIEFTGNPFAAWGALTLGNTIVWGPEKGSEFYKSFSDHEMRHTIQGQFLGPLYFPTHLFAMLAAVLSSPFPSARRTVDGATIFHGKLNFMEGPIFKDELY